MDEKSFCMWLQGFVEMNPNAMITHTQWEILKDHLKLVFKKETPYRGNAPGISPVYGISPVHQQPIQAVPYPFDSAVPYFPDPMKITC